ncbi:hypothetical protein [Billgrantia gudaonensis]|uniref:hypothetical protein n=1 Tax=Billgrantia gudaonensis TaxID=376427 RepID=UPI00115FDC14|nr:hypothetical protein [Halomonas gudaonensis]
MIKIAALVTLMMIPYSAHSDNQNWTEVEPGIFVNRPTSGGGVHIFASHDTHGSKSIFFVGLEHFFCAPEQNSFLPSIGAPRVNGMHVEMSLSCLNGTEVYRAASPAGKVYIRNEVSGSNSLTIEFGGGNTFSYDLRGYEAVNDALDNINP